jgi:hypothetical protein
MPNIYFTQELIKETETPDSDDEALVSASNGGILKYIETSVGELDLNAMTQIYRIVKNAGERFTMKKDCILINLGALKQSTITEILQFIRYLRKNNKQLMVDELTKDEYKKEMVADAIAT